MTGRTVEAAGGIAPLARIAGVSHVSTSTGRHYAVRASSAGPAARAAAASRRPRSATSRRSRAASVSSSGRSPRSGSSSSRSSGCGGCSPSTAERSACSCSRASRWPISRPACRASTGSSSAACAARCTWPRSPAGASRSSPSACRRTRRSTSSPTSCERSRRCAIRTTAGCSTRGPILLSRRWPRELGVRYFTRKGKPLWNQPGPPFQAKTKAGNVNAWLDYVSMEGLDYEVFVQLDIDHRPIPEYLDRTLGYFEDPEVAWVQAPSVASNLDRWTARGLAEQDLVLQGPLQMGFYGHSRTPFIIGSHTTYRTAAVRAIGGFQPTRAEDHLDTVVLAAAGYTGVYVPEIIAEGDGPADFGTYLGQQFAWAYSMVQIFLQHTPRLRAALQPGPGLPVPHGPELVPAVVAVAGGALGPADRRAADRRADRSRRALGVPRLPPGAAAGFDAHVVVEPALVPAAGHRADVARPAARGRPLADRPLGRGQRAAADQASLHDHAEGGAARRAAAGAPPLRAADRPRRAGERRRVDLRHGDRALALAGLPRPRPVQRVHGAGPARDDPVPRAARPPSAHRPAGRRPATARRVAVRARHDSPR